MASRKLHKLIFKISNSGYPSICLGMRMQTDRLLFNASVWSIRDVLAVEPFINISTDPGQKISWVYTYTYSDLSSAH